VCPALTTVCRFLGGFPPDRHTVLKTLILIAVPVDDLASANLTEFDGYRLRVITLRAFKGSLVVSILIGWLNSR
jgi:hypothetical protein